MELFTNFKNLIISGHLLLRYDWPLVPKPAVINIQQEDDQLFKKL